MLEIVYLLHADYGGPSEAINFFSKVSSLTTKLKTEISFTCLAKGFLSTDFDAFKLDFNVVYVPNIGRDIYSYLSYCERSKSDFLMFFNTSSKVCSSDFFSSCLEQLLNDKCGAVSATASSGSIINGKYFLKLARLSKPNSFFKGEVKYILGLAGEIAARTIGYQPVIHLRTNAFGISRVKLISLIKTIGKLPISRFASLCFESGERGMSNLLRQDRQSMLVVDKLGQSYDLDNCLQSQTYCCYGQAKLAVSDNRTAEYHYGDLNMKRKLFIGTWCNTEYFDLNIRNRTQLDEHL